MLGAGLFRNISVAFLLKGKCEMIKVYDLTICYCLIIPYFRKMFVPFLSGQKRDEKTRRSGLRALNLFHFAC